MLFIHPASTLVPDTDIERLCKTPAYVQQHLSAFAARIVKFSYSHNKIVIMGNKICLSDRQLKHSLKIGVEKKYSELNSVQFFSVILTQISVHKSPVELTDCVLPIILLVTDGAQCFLHWH